MYKKMYVCPIIYNHKMRYAKLFNESETDF